MDPLAFTQQVAGIAALAEPVRRELYLYVAAQGHPVSRDDASRALDLPRHTVKFHLDRLVEDGLLDVAFKRLSGREGPGAGRPTKLYHRTARELSVTLPERRYALAGDLMAAAISDSVHDGTPVREALQRAASARGGALGSQVREALGRQPSRTACVDGICSALEVLGYEPRPQEQVVELANCPFHALAEQHRDLVCGMNLDFISALVEEVGDPGLHAELRPEAGRCCVVITH